MIKKGGVVMSFWGNSVKLWSIEWAIVGGEGTVCMLCMRVRGVFIFLGMMEGLLSAVLWVLISGLWL